MSKLKKLEIIMGHFKWETLEERLRERLKS